MVQDLDTRVKEGMKGLPILVFFCFFISILTEYSIAVNTISSSNFLTDGQTLVSPGEVFELGFFGNESRYLGMWYKNISNHTVVWVANRDTPLTDLFGVLTIDDGGNLVLLNGSGSVIWSTNISEIAIDPVAQLLETGNLVLINNNSGNAESYLWQSFDYPSHTLLAGMKLGWTSKDGLNRYLTSWKNETDPSSGEFSVGIEDPELPQVVVRYRSSKHNRIGPYNGIRFSGGPEFEGENFEAVFVYDKNEVYYLDKPEYPSAIVRFELTPSGFFEHSYWNYPVGNWSIPYSLDQDRCDSYNKCGENGVCRKKNLRTCICLDEFTPKFPKDWNLGNYSGGCVPKKPLNCVKGDEFRKFTRLQLPDTLHYWLNMNISLEECRAACLKNCSCMAYANSNISEDSGCILWFENLVDIQQFDEGGQELYIRMGSNSGSNKKENKLDVEKVILPLVSVVLVLSLLVGYIVWKKRSNRKGNNIINSRDVASTNRSHDENFELPLLDLLTIATATNNFSFSNKIGEGGFGPVYKGVLPKGEEIAIKRLSTVSKQGIQEFMNEVVLIAKLQHRNLVRLLGCCIEGDERMLIYEYMPNKSLDFFIFDETRRINLDWNKRFNIIVGIARGLLYLHRDSRLTIIHRDLKAGNILLDSQMNPKISDFGMAKTFGGDQTEDNTRRVVGTYGYMSPEYQTDGLFSMKSDVFSFGVLVLEIVSGKRNRGFHHAGHALNLLGHTWKLLRDEKALELADESIKDSCTVSEVLKCIQVGLLCVQTFPQDRPGMSSVLSMLDSGEVMLPWPKEPGFYTARSPFKKDPSSTQTTSNTENVTITLLQEGR